MLWRQWRHYSTWCEAKFVFSWHITHARTTRYPKTLLTGKTTNKTHFFLKDSCIVIALQVITSLMGGIFLCIFMYILTLHCIFLAPIYSRILAFWLMLSVVKTTLNKSYLILSIFKHINVNKDADETKIFSMMAKCINYFMMNLHKSTRSPRSTFVIVKYH